MFERYSVLARQAVFLARKGAGETGATSIDTEHLLIGILTVYPELPGQLSVEIDSTTVIFPRTAHQTGSPGQQPFHPTPLSICQFVTHYSHTKTAIKTLPLRK